MYPQGDKGKYWFEYRDKRFEDIEDCDEQYMILECRKKHFLLLDFQENLLNSIWEC